VPSFSALPDHDDSGGRRCANGGAAVRLLVRWGRCRLAGHPQCRERRTRPARFTSLKIPPWIDHPVRRPANRPRPPLPLPIMSPQFSNYKAEEPIMTPFPARIH